MDFFKAYVVTVYAISIAQHKFLNVVIYKELLRPQSSWYQALCLKLMLAKSPPEILRQENKHDLVHNYKTGSLTESR